MEPFRASDSSVIVPFISLASFRHIYNESKKKREREEEEKRRRREKNRTGGKEK